MRTSAIRSASRGELGQQMLPRTRFKLYFGPYRTPRLRLGAMVQDEVRGQVRIGVSAGRIPWPIGQKGPGQVPGGVRATGEGGPPGIEAGHLQLVGRRCPGGSEVAPGTAGDRQPMLSDCEISLQCRRRDTMGQRENTRCRFR